MKSFSLLIVAALVLSACSGSRNTVTRVAVPATNTLFATGPIYSACRSSGRDAANRSRCGCVQAVANRELDASDQRRGAGFFGDPHQAQVVRQSDRSIDERFWLRWKDYSQTAARLCS
ncbi:hypothetical protein [uncultured Tateyamaria sp.]|uniref:hypothetical protein n=1 Tax=Tateyamaria sp. 1078 TaxID=3417464 RepID=UPI00261AA9CB|nr:hypothetical protein [uncultured Tateyamaria sp.]